MRAGATLRATPHVVLANELLDNLPFRRVHGDREVRVGVDGDRFVEIEAAWGDDPHPSDDAAVVPVGAFAFIDRLASSLTAATRC